MTSSALSTGTLVKSAVTSYDTSFRAGSISSPLNLSTTSLVFLMLWQFLPTRGVSILASYLAALYVMLPQLDTIGLRGVLFLRILGVPYNFGGSSDSGYSFQYSLSEMDPFLFHFLRMLIILFLYLCVGSFLSLVYVFVSPTMSVIFSLDIRQFHDYRGSTFVCREYDDGLVCFQCL